VKMPMKGWLLLDPLRLLSPLSCQDSNARETKLKIFFVSFKYNVSDWLN